MEGIHGLKREGDRLTVKPSLPAAWDGYSATLQLDGKAIRLRVVAEAGAQGIAISVNGQPADHVPLGDDAEVVVTVGRKG